VTIEDSSLTKAVSIADRSVEHWECSRTAQVLRRLKDNPCVKYIVLAVPSDACPVCQGLAGTYPKEDVLHLPLDLCSHPLGCRAYYLPFLDEIFP
jgi:hypothetical protein